MENELNCQFCNGEYRDDNLPRILTLCGHTLCQKCLDTLLVESDQSFKLTCPEDQTVIHIKTKDLSFFPKNIALIKLIDAKKGSPNSSSFKDQSLDITKIVKKDDLNEDEQTKDLIIAIQEGQQQKSVDLKTNKDEGTKSEVENSEQQEANMCLLHQKPLDIVCLVDLQRICAKCAIFGEHKGHDFTSIENVDQQCNQYRNQIVQIYSKKEMVCKRLENQETKRQILGLLGEKKYKLQKEVNDRFKKLMEKIKKAEENCLKKLDEAINKTEGKMKKVLTVNEDIIDQYDQWQQKSYQHLLIVEKGTFEEKLQLLYGEKGKKINPDVIISGQKVVNRIVQKEDELFSEVQHILESIQVNFCEELSQKIESFANIAMKKVEEKPKITNTLILNEKVYANLEEKSQLDLMEKMNRIPQSPSQQENLLEYEHKDKLKESPIRLFTSKKQNSSQRKEESPLIKAQIFNKIEIIPSKFDLTSTRMKQNGDQLNTTFEKTEKIERISISKKKLKNIKVPQKYEKMLESLLSDSLQILDLTNSELGDTIILQIMQLIRGTKVKTVKLIRCKITDDLIAKMMPFLGAVITLNLSQNSLTEHAIQTLIASREQMPQLKSVILSQNKIIERKHKIFIDKLRKMDLTVSI